MGRTPEQTFLQRGHTDGQQANENITRHIFNITSYYRNVNQNYNEISPHIGENPQITNVIEDVDGRELSCTIGGNVNWYRYYGEKYGNSLKN